MKRADKLRIARMLEQDKEDMNASTRAAAMGDFKRVAEEYFEAEGPVSLALGREKSGFTVSVTFRARRVKNFTTLK